MKCQQRTHAPIARNSNAEALLRQPGQCMWNKKYKGYHFKSICDELKVAFKPHHSFMAELGGYAKNEDLESK